MYWPERNREVLLYEIIFTYHPRFRDTPKWFRHTSSYHIEGGDVLNLNNDALLIGLSQRTEAAAIDTLARNLLWSEGTSTITSLYAVEVPSTGTRLHLDTYLNRIDYDAFIVDPHILNATHLYRITKGRRAGDIHVSAASTRCNLHNLHGRQYADAGARAREQRLRGTLPCSGPSLHIRREHADKFSP